MARGGKERIGTLQLLVEQFAPREGRHPAEEVAQSPQLRLSQRGKEGCVCGLLEQLPFPIHLLEELPAYSMP